VLGPTGSLARIKNPVRVHLALEPTQERRPGRCRMGSGVRDPGVQVVGRHAGPQRWHGRGGRRPGGTFAPPGRAGAGVSGVTSAPSPGREFFSAH
jgi:hypothetical protein